MKNWIKILLLVIVCIVIVCVVYVWKFGVPDFSYKKTDTEYVQTIYSLIDIKDSTITASNIDNGIEFTQKITEDKTQTITFLLEDNILQTAIFEDQISEDFINKAIEYVFVAVAKNGSQSEENAIHSLIPDILNTKTLENDGYQKTIQNGVIRFKILKNEKLNLAESQEVYIKTSDIENIYDVLKSKLQNKIIEKPGIVLEKAISYSDSLVYIIYEKEKLTTRTYNSLFTLLNLLLKDTKKVEHIKANYPVITHAGTFYIDGVTISLNEKIKEQNVHYYNMPQGYEYMVVRINIDELER